MSQAFLQTLCCCSVIALILEPPPPSCLVAVFQPADSSPGWELFEFSARGAGLSGEPDLPRLVLQLLQLRASHHGEAQRHGEALFGREPALGAGCSWAAVAACPSHRPQVNMIHVDRFRCSPGTKTHLKSSPSCFALLLHHFVPWM